MVIFLIFNYFENDLQERYTAFLRNAQELVMNANANICEDVSSIKKTGTVKVGALLPHEITEKARVCHLNRLNLQEPEKLIEEKLDEEKLEVDLQWYSITQNLYKTMASTAKRCWVPVCDVSGSMSGEPMQVAIALSLLLAEVNRPETGWHGKMFTFDTEPELISVFDLEGSSIENPIRDIGEAAYRVSEMGWGGSTDIVKTMQLFCKTAQANQTSIEEMTHHGLVIFSDMMFDNAVGESWETTHETIVKLFRNAGYPTAPRIIYWNLRASHLSPVAQDTKGVVLMSGFSTQLLNNFLDGNLDDFTPIAQLRAVLEKKAYADLRIN